MSALGREQGSPYYVAKVISTRGWVMITNGLTTEGTALMRAALSALRRTGDEEFMPHSLGLLAEAQAKLQETLQALSLVRDALARVTRTGERLFEADLHRLAGDLLVALMQPDQAQECFHRAITVARGQDARLGSCALRPALPGCGATRAARRRARPARAGLRLVHRGLRHRRPEGRQGAARRAGMRRPAA